MQVDWRDVSVIINKKEILAPCSASLRSGQMTALMGPSGSGKSTLLNCLRHDIPHGGEMRFNGGRFTSSLRQLIGYAEQDDVIIPELTVWQTLSFLAQLRYGFRSAEADAAVARVLSTVRLEHAADRTVGTPDSDCRISGGERKRLCIARELLAEPTLMLCDEPTSGLDSTMAGQVVMTLRNLCDDGDMTVLTSIHQPSSDIFLNFDQLILLKDGHVLYSGATADAEAMFASHGLVRQPSQSTPEYLMNYLVLGIDEPDGMPLETLMLMRRNIDQQRQALAELGTPRRLSKGIELPFDPPFHRQLLLLVYRHGRLLWDAKITKLSCVQFVVLTLIPSLLWVELGDTDADVYPRMGVCMWLIGTWMFFSIFGNLGLFQQFRNVLEKELKLGYYSVNAMYIARTLIVLPIEFVWPTVFTAGVFWITQLRLDVIAYLQVQLLIYLSITLFSGVGLCISASNLAPPQASVFAMSCVVFFFGWCGIFRDMSQVPSWISWVNEVNCFVYVIQTMVHVVLPDGLEFKCGFVVTRDRAYSSSNAGCTVNERGDFVLSAREARKRLGVDRDPAVCLAVACCFAAVFRLLALALVHYDLWSTVHGAAEYGLISTTKGKRDDASIPARVTEGEDVNVDNGSKFPNSSDDATISTEEGVSDHLNVCEDDIAITIEEETAFEVPSSTTLSI